MEGLRSLRFCLSKHVWKCLALTQYGLGSIQESVRKRDLAANNPQQLSGSVTLIHPACTSVIL